MKSSQILTLLGFVALGLAQSLPPSPVASVDCEPHGDHWHCDGPRVTTAPGQSAAITSAATTTRTSTHSHDHDDDNDHSKLPPSPTASVGCQPHGDHWHCDGPKTASAAAGTVTSAAVTSAIASGITTTRVTTATPSGSPTRASGVTSATPAPAGAARAGFGAAAAIVAAGAVLIL